MASWSCQPGIFASCHPAAYLLYLIELYWMFSATTAVVVYYTSCFFLRPAFRGQGKLFFLGQTTLLPLLFVGNIIALAWAWVQARKDQILDSWEPEPNGTKLPPVPPPNI
jgi:hypothetical protein